MRKLSNTPIQHFRPVGRDKQKRILSEFFTRINTTKKESHKALKLTTLCDQILNHMTMDIGQAIISPLESVSQLFMIKSK